MIRSVTVKAPVNIAVIKYWGKKDEKVIIPLNDSISATLSIDEMCAMTTVALSPDFTSDQMWLNGVEQSIERNKRLDNCIKQMRLGSKSDWAHYHVRICSRNNFPTAAGLASSAAGYACLVYALGQVLDITDPTTLSKYARLGSGSACRSIFGGWVQWVTGVDHETSIARQIADVDHWTDMRVLILVVNDNQKDVSSTSGMQQTVATSELIKLRVDKIVAERTEQMIEAIRSRDFQTFAEITMKDSNQIHALAFDTWPPIRYMNDISWSIARLCHKYNDYYGCYRIAYTFDAGPNACIYLPKDEVPQFLKLITTYYPQTEAVKGIPVTPVEKLPQDLINAIEPVPIMSPGAIRYVISTKVGVGPQISNESLLDARGNPI